jgi:hypothetical protein
VAKNYLTLRRKYPKFIFEKYSWQVFRKDLKISFFFKIEPNIRFKPTIVIKNVTKNRVKEIGEDIIDNLVFNLGLIEILSYWKATCSPEIEILAGPLNEKQLAWWQDLIIKGMGQFFYENKINFSKPDFLKIISQDAEVRSSLTFEQDLKEKIVVPIGGGKDSIVTLELLKKARKNITCFTLNPNKATRNTMKIAGYPTKTTHKKTKTIGYKQSIIVRRQIDKKLLELNREGFLNGHTPFSAYLAFLSVLCAVLFDHKFIAFSNERSANEENLNYLDLSINHQYSKSFEFEKKFRKYSKKYLAKDVEYFSFLRPLYEIQVAKIFSQYSKYFSSFISCNTAFKTYSGKKKPLGNWCTKCAKCLFVFVALYPFVAKYRLIRIFKENLFKRIGFLPLMRQLVGEKDFKPFECVGTQKESLAAFYLSWEKTVGKTPVKNIELPFLLEYFERNILPKYPNLEKEAKKIMNSWNDKHYLPKGFKRILKDATWA